MIHPILRLPKLSKDSNLKTKSSKGGNRPLLFVINQTWVVTKILSFISLVLRFVMKGIKKVNTPEYRFNLTLKQAINFRFIV
jgi:hypothetical protein